ncbi:MAG TPA: hypothetical protein GX736_02345 [Mogibacterium sp.]|nr:hypothetical protein [Mogibacterium sp.]
MSIKNKKNKIRVYICALVVLIIPNVSAGLIGTIEKVTIIMRQEALGSGISLVVRQYIAEGLIIAAFIIVVLFIQNYINNESNKSWVVVFVLAVNLIFNLFPYFNDTKTFPTWGFTFAEHFISVMVALIILTLTNSIASARKKD